MGIVGKSFLFLFLIGIGLAPFLMRRVPSNALNSISKGNFITSIPMSAIGIPIQEQYIVTKVIDGDTIVIDMNGDLETVRLIGIDSPEVVDPNRPKSCFGKAASDRVKALLVDKSVLLEADPTQADRDTYGRLLRFVFLEDGTNFNKFMLTEGHAKEYTFKNIPYTYQDEFIKAEDIARRMKKGIWSDDALKLCEGL